MTYPASTPVACFFDPAHGFAAAAVAWQPPHGVPRPTPVCLGCQQRLATEPSQPAQPQPVQPHPTARPEHDGDDSGVGGAVLAGAGGLAGGMLLGSLFGGDEPSGDDDWF